MSKHFILDNSVSESKTVLFQTIQFIISSQFSSVYPLERVPPCATTAGQSEPGSDGDGDEGVLYIHQSSCIIGTWPSERLVSYPGPPQEVGSYRSAEILLVYSTAG